VVSGSGMRRFVPITMPGAHHRHALVIVPSGAVTGFAGRRCLDARLYSVRATWHSAHGHLR
jgi:hypothetical protein